MLESTIMKLVRLAAAKCDAVTFRINSGTGWTGEVVKRFPDGSILIRNARPFRSGWPKGGCDLFGWKSILITQEMVGQVIAVAAGVECKALKGKVSTEQLNFLEQLKNAGGIAIVARSEDDVIEGIKKWYLKNRNQEK